MTEQCELFISVVHYLEYLDAVLPARSVAWRELQCWLLLVECMNNQSHEYSVPTVSNDAMDRRECRPATATRQSSKAQKLESARACGRHVCLQPPPLSC